MRFTVEDDQANLNFVRSQAAHIEAEVYRQRYPTIQYPELIPVDTSAPEFVQSVIYASMNGVGTAQWINGNAMDVPTVDVAVNQSTTFVETAGIGYQYGWQELGYWRMMGMSIDTEKAMTARRVSEEFIEAKALSGDTAKNFQGLINNSAITPANVALNGAAASRLWSAKTPIEVMADLNEALTTIYTGTLQIEQADTLLLPPSAFAYLVNTPMSVDNPTPIMTNYRLNNLYTQLTNQPLTIRTVRQLETAGASGTRRFIAYARDPGVLKMHLPMPHRFFPAQQVIFQYLVPGAFRFGGVDIRRPGAVKFRDAF